MERHRCKLCSRIFSNGRALGGHMRSHLANLPQLGDRTESDSSSTRSEHEHEIDFSVKKAKPLVYVLRDNPKKSVKASNSEFLDAGSVVQDRESETESTQNPTRKRSKKSNSKSVRVVTKSESATESTPVSSIITDPSQDEEVALCLMMLSRDVWVRAADSAELKTRSTTTRRIFKRNRALAGHIKATSSKKCQQENIINIIGDNNQKIYECPFCSKVFGSGQALGGHKRSHLLGSSTNNNFANSNNNNASIIINGNNNNNGFILDLNMPAPIEDDEKHSQIDFL